MRRTGTGTGSRRRQGRERALSLLYEAECRGVAVGEVLAELPVAPDRFVCGLVTGVEEHRDELDALLRKHSEGWALERMPALDRAALRMGTFELLHVPDVPTAVVISEAVDLAKRYSTEESGRFVNGMLSAIANQARTPSAQ